MTVSDLTPPANVQHSCAKDDYRFNEILDNPLFNEEALQSNDVSCTDVCGDSGGPILDRSTSMPPSFAPLMSTDIQRSQSTSQVDSPIFQAEARPLHTAVEHCSVSVQTSPIERSTLTQATDTSPESITGAVSTATQIIF
jgi:hypothetical protein